MVRPHLKFLFGVPAGWFMKSLEISILALCLVLVMYDLVFGQEFKISTYLEPESLTVGDKFLFVNTINDDNHYKIGPAPVEEQIGDAVVISNIYKIRNTEPGTIAYACTLAVYRPGEAEIPSFIFNITDSLGNTQGILGKSVRTTIRSVLPRDTTDLEIADIREPIKLGGPIWPYLFIPLAIGIIALFIYLAGKYFRKKLQVPVIPPRPPWEVAYEKLDGLKAEKHAEFGRLKKYYFELSIIMREYIEARFRFPAAEYTTYELENSDQLKEIDGNLYRRIFVFFYRADLAKFAKFLPAVEDADSDLKFAYDFISRTMPVAESEESKHEGLVEVLK
jgi:hypothetical protein